MVRTKVFVGNLSFTITEAELLTEFNNAGKAISANIITRGPRSLGYGFVEMDSEEDAKKAVAAMHRKEINGRQINVEVAKPLDETKKPREPKAEGENAAPRQQRPRTKRPTKPSTGPKSEVNDEGRPAPRPRTKRVPVEGESDEAAVKKTRAPRTKATSAPKRSTEPREESKTTLFVANLPFNLNDDEFAKILTEKGLKLKSAHVVSKKNGKSKGYGFVEFDTQDDQQKALAALHKTTVDARELSVKVALTELKLQEEENAQGEKTAAAPSEKKVASPAPKQAAEKKVATPEKKAVLEKKVATPNAEKKSDVSSPKTTPAAVPSEKKSTPTAEKNTAAPEKK